MDEQADDDVMHSFEFREADGFAGQTFDPSAQGQVFSFDFLGVSLSNRMLFFIEMTCIGAPVIGIELLDAKRFQ